MTPDKVRECLKVGRTLVSLDLKVGKEQDTSLSELIEDKSAALTEDIEQGLMKEGVRQLLAKLDSREQEVIALRFGFVDGEEWSLGAIGKKLNLSRERIRQIENKALKKLRHKRNVALRDYLAG